MKKTELQELVQECIAEVLDERKSKGDDEFKRVDKGVKGKVAKDKGEEEVYGAGYAAGEKAAKTKYKKLAEAYKQLKEDGFGIGPRGLEINDGGKNRSINEITKFSTDADAVIKLIEKNPMLLQKLTLLSSGKELEDVFNYFFTKINPQFSQNTIGIRTAANNAAQNTAKKPAQGSKKMEETRSINEEVDLINQIASIDWETAIPVLSAVGLLSVGAISTLKQALKNPKELADRVRKEM